MKNKIETWFVNFWENIRNISFFLWAILLVVTYITLGFWGVLTLTTGGLIFSCTWIILIALLWIRETLVAMYTQWKKDLDDRNQKS